MKVVAHEGSTAQPHQLEKLKIEKLRRPNNNNNNNNTLNILSPYGACHHG